MTDNNTQKAKYATDELDNIIANAEMEVVEAFAECTNRTQDKIIATVETAKANIKKIHFISKMIESRAFLDEVKQALGYVAVPFTVATRAGDVAFVALWSASFESDLMKAEKTHNGVKSNALAYIEKWVDIITAFQDELPHVLTDRGDQRDLFEAPITEHQRALWNNYEIMPRESRRMWILTGCVVLYGSYMFLTEYTKKITEYKAGTTPQKKRGRKTVMSPDLPPFAAIFNMQALNDLAGITPHTPFEIDKESDKKIIKRGKKGKETEIAFDLNKISVELAKVGIGAIKLLDYGAHKLTQKNRHKRLSERTEKDKAEFNAFMPQLEVRIPEEEYATVTGIKLTPENLRHCRADWRKQLSLLQALTLTGGWGGGTFFSCELCGDVAVKNGYIYIVFGLNFARFLIGSFVSYMPRAIFALDNNKPILYHLARRLVNHYGMDNNRKNGTFNIMGIRTLLDSCDEIPSEEEVRNSKTNRSLTLRRLKPLEDALNVLQERKIITWEYANAKGEPLREEQLNQEYKDVIDAYIKFDVVGYPDPTPRLEKKAKEEEERKKKLAQKEEAKKRKKYSNAKVL